MGDQDGSGAFGRTDAKAGRKFRLSSNENTKYGARDITARICSQNEGGKWKKRCLRK